MGLTFYFTWEPALIIWLQQLLGVAALPFGAFFSILGEEYVLILLLAFLYLCYDKEKGKKVALIMIAGLLYNSMLKNLIHRRRPYFDNPEVKCLRAAEPGVDPQNMVAQGFSFPSGHSMNAVTSYGSVARYFRNKWTLALAIALPLLIGLSRVVLGVHYPTDVLVGWVVGTVTMFVFSYLQDHCSTRTTFLVMLITTLPGFFFCSTSDFFTCYGILLGFYAADWLDRKYVNFETSRDPLQILIRLVGVFGLFLLLNVLFKLPFNKEWLEEKGTLQFMVRTIRYALTVFLIMGVFPLCFKYTDRFSFRKHS